MRAKAWSYVLLVIYTSQIFGNYVNPVGIANIGWRFYIYYCVWAAIIVLIVYFFFVETSGPTLEELALIFDGPQGDRKLSLGEFEDEKRDTDIEGEKEKEKTVVATHTE